MRLAANYSDIERHFGRFEPTQGFQGVFLIPAIAAGVGAVGGYIASRRGVDSSGNPLPSPVERATDNLTKPLGAVLAVALGAYALKQVLK